MGLKTETVSLQNAQGQLQELVNEKFGLDICDQPNYPVRLNYQSGGVLLTVFEGANGNAHEWYPSREALDFSLEKSKEILSPFGIVVERDPRNAAAEDVQATATTRRPGGMD